jgi:cobalamin biosynthesis Mg chelatase CobN
LPTLEAATAVQATTESNPTGQPAAEATGVPEQTPRAEDAAAEQGSAQAVPQSAVDSSSEVAVVATAVSPETENSQSEDLQNRPGNEISEAAPAVPQNEQIDSSIADSQDLEKAKEPLSVIGENVAAPTPAPVKTAAEGSNAIFPSPVTVVVLIAIIILFILSLAGFFFLRRSA